MADWPSESVQGLVDFDWWLPCPEPKKFRRGQLVRAFVPHADQTPYRLVAEGREEATDHRNVRFTIEATKVGDPNRNGRLPVAALPSLPPGETYAVYRAKVRPCLVISTGGEPVPTETGTASWMTFPTFTLAPYFGVDQGGGRGGWRPEFVERIRRVEYPQYVWDKLPLGGNGPEASILRLDQAQPVGRHYNSVEPLPWMLSDDALAVVDEWHHWLTFDRWPSKKEVALRTIRELLKAP